MKKRILGILVCSMFLLGISITIVKSVEAQTGDTTYVCEVSPNAGENGGHCKTLSSGNGTMCFTFGSGGACSGTIYIRKAGIH